MTPAERVLRLLADMLAEIVACAVAMRVEVLRHLLMAAAQAHGDHAVAFSLRLCRGAPLETLHEHAALLPGLSLAMRQQLGMVAA